MKMGKTYEFREKSLIARDIYLTILPIPNFLIELYLRFEEGNVLQ